MLYQVLIVLYLINAIVLVGFILIQQGKGADMGASFGSGSSATIFGSSGSANFMSRTTSFLATMFFLLSLVLGNLTTQRTQQTEEWNNLGTPATQGVESPATDVPAGNDKSESDVPN